MKRQKTQDSEIEQCEESEHALVIHRAFLRTVDSTADHVPIAEIFPLHSKHNYRVDECNRLVTTVTGTLLGSGLYSEYRDLSKAFAPSLLAATTSRRSMHHCHAGLCGAPATVLRNTDDGRQHRRFANFVCCVRPVLSPRDARMALDGCRRHGVVVLAKPRDTVLAFQIRNYKTNLTPVSFLPRLRAQGDGLVINLIATIILDMTA